MFHNSLEVDLYICRKNRIIFQNIHLSRYLVIIRNLNFSYMLLPLTLPSSNQALHSLQNPYANSTNQIPIHQILTVSDLMNSHQKLRKKQAETDFLKIPCFGIFQTL